jgi:hypothetical protein
VAAGAAPAGRRLTQISAGTFHVCALDSAGPGPAGRSRRGPAHLLGARKYAAGAIPVSRRNAAVNALAVS